MSKQEEEFLQLLKELKEIGEQSGDISIVLEQYEKKIAVFMKKYGALTNETK